MRPAAARSYLAMPTGQGRTRIAYRFIPGAGPAILFLPGYRSDMAGTKAQAIFAWASAAGRPCLLFDYSGCGESSGDFAAGTLGRWLGEAEALIAHLGLKRVLLVGSSMGGWLMLLLARALGNARVAGMIGIAAAPDFTAWGFSPAQQAALAADETIHEANPYGPDPTPTYPGFWADGQKRRLLGFDSGTTVATRLIHGAEDRDVPWDISCRLAATFHSGAVQLIRVEGGDHRLSRPGDIALILAVLGDVLAMESAASCCMPC